MSKAMTKASHTSSKATPIDHSKLDVNRFGFWVYILTDCILFATLFATYAVLHNNVAEGPTAKQIFELPFVLTETILLLTSSFTIGLALLAAKLKNIKQSMIFLGMTFVLGSIFLGMEFYEFNHLFQNGHSWQASAFLSSYFVLVGTHGLHIMVGLMWLLVLAAKIRKTGLNDVQQNNLTIFGIFWHFLDIIWIFIFSFVYLMGAA